MAGTRIQVCAWTPLSRHTFWAAISRAVRTPDRRAAGLDATLAVLPGPAQIILFGDPRIKSEHVLAYELGYRTIVGRYLSIDLTGFYNDFTNLQVVEPGAPYTDNSATPLILVQPRFLVGKMNGNADGD